MKTQHTPGPWNNKGGRVCHGDSQDTDFKIAEVFGDNHKANGDLIAAAPELLTLAERCKEYLKHADGHHLPASEFFALNEELRAIIAKAKGE